MSWFFAIGLLLGLGGAGLLTGCGEERVQSGQGEPMRLMDREAVAPSQEIEDYARRVAARIEGAIGRKIDGGLRVQGVKSGADGVLFEITILSSRAADFAPPTQEAKTRVLRRARANLAQSSCPFASRIERMLLEAGGEIRHRYQFEDGRPSYELALRLEDCQPVWKAAAEAFATPLSAAPFAEAQSEPAAAAPARAVRTEAVTDGTAAD
ncbi:MAG: hypothetical protein AAGM38_18430 [Pseudomonadota bacterium]